MPCHFRASSAGSTRSSAALSRPLCSSVCFPRPKHRTVLVMMLTAIGVLCLALGAIPLGSSTAFLDLTGSFIILSTVSYGIPFLANVVTGRKYFPKGPFHLGKYGFAINIIAVLFICLFNILYCFRKPPLPFQPNVAMLTRHSILHPYRCYSYEL
jgi:hypothetical protein